MNQRRSFLTLEHALYLALFALALALRLYRLNTPPLADAEAREALTVFRFLRGAPEANLPHSPAYFFFTYFGFLIFDAGNAAARLAPALFGAGLVFLPSFFRDRLGRPAALAAGGLLAISASLLAASRAADGAVIALFALGLCLGALCQYMATGWTTWLVAAAGALGLGIAGGGSFLTGLLILAVTALVMTWVNPEERDALAGVWAGVRAHGLTGLVALGCTLLLVVTVGAIYRAGIGALADSWVGWLAGFAPSAPGRAPLTLLTFVLVYEPFNLVLGIAGAALAFRSGHRFARWLFWFFLAAQALAMVYSARTLFHTLWIIAPLAALAGWAVVEIVRRAWAREEWYLVAVQAGVIVVLLSFAAINLAALGEQLRLNPGLALTQITLGGVSLRASPVLFLYLALGAVALIFIVSYLFGMGWSPRAATLGLTVSGALATLAMSAASAWGLTQLRPASPLELWWERPVSDDVNRLMAVLGDVSNFTVGNEHDLQVTVQAAPDGALGWALRNFPHAAFVEELDPLINSPAVIAPANPGGEQNPTLGSAYVGQGFDYRAAWPALDLNWQGWLAWWAFRRGEAQTEGLILWVRQDVAQLRDAETAP
jgi:hypothetical protein